MPAGARVQEILDPYLNPATRSSMAEKMHTIETSEVEPPPQAPEIECRIQISFDGSRSQPF